MIYPRLNRVRNGQRLSVELVNGLIKRTEYAGDLLRQGKCLAGTEISVAQKYDGTTISGGEEKYRIVGLGSIGGPLPRQSVIFDPFLNTVFNLPRPFEGDGIDGEDVVGNDFYFNGTDFQIIAAPGALPDRTFINKIRNKIAAGSFQYARPGNFYGDGRASFTYNVITGQFSIFNPPGYDNSDAHGIYGNTLCGQAYTDAEGVEESWYFNGSSFQNLDSLIGGINPSPNDIYENYIVGSTAISSSVRKGFILDINTGDIIYVAGPVFGRPSVFLNGIYKNICVGFASNNTNQIPIQYDILTGQVSEIIIPSTSVTFLRATGIG